ncbi:MAG: hypothetical protein KGZ41_01585 [Dethiobacter sp.]|jgi:hypothetical protein|nr:hypothetical protein [Dethiobacter sp.]MBS3982471.1 hypothetical protein [Dethiobacter sp.]
MQTPKPYYIVAIPDGIIMTELLKLQKLISRKFKMYTEPYPTLHLTVGILAHSQKLEFAVPILRKMFNSLSPFSVRIQGKSCFKAPFLSVGVDIQSQPLSYLAGKVEGTLLKAGFFPRSFSDWDFHISLVSPHFAGRQWSNAEFNQACKIVEGYAPVGIAHISRLELWAPDFPPLKILGQFTLKGAEN